MRTESPEEVANSSSRANVETAAKVGKWAAQLAAYGLATIAVTFVLLRPTRSGKRGSLFMGSGVLVVLIKTLLSTPNATDATPAPPAPALASTAVRKPVPAPSSAPVRKSASNETVVSFTPRPIVVAAPRSQKPAASVATAEAPKAKPAVTAAPATAPIAKTPSPLGPRYIDKDSGYSVQFPADWHFRTPADNGTWVFEASDGNAAVISVGFSRLAANVTIDQVSPERVSRALQKRQGTTVHAWGYTTIAGRRCLWHRYTGPVARFEGTVRMTAIHYLIPLQDGRALEIRLAAAPEKFNELGPRMKQSVDTFKLLTKVADASPR
jgi:hypothetical protein